MKNLTRLVIFGTLVMAFALPALAQDTPPATAAPAAAATQCDEKSKAEIYERWRNNRKGDAAAQKTAYDAGTEYMQKCGSTRDEYLTAVEKWVNNYNKATREFEYTKAVDKAATATATVDDYVAAFRLGRELIAAQPDRLKILTELGWMGYLASAKNNDSLIGDASNYSKRAIQLIGEGKTPMCMNATGTEVACWGGFFATKEDAVGGLNFASGSYAVKGKRPEEAAVFFYNAAQQNGFTKKEPSTYANLGAAYAAFAEYRNLIQQYQDITKDPNNAGSEQAKAILARLDPMTDRIVDAYARAVALSSGADPKSVASKAEYMKRLTDFYKFRNNNSETGLNELVASVLNKQMPSATETPAPTTAPTPAASSGATVAGDGGMTTTPTTPARVTTTTTTTTTTAKPAGTTSTAKPTTAPTPKPKS